jgi:hypothetical protein
MECKRSLLCTQELIVGPYLQPHQYSTYHPTLFLYNPSKYHPPSYIWVILVVCFLLAFPPKPHMHSSSPPCVLYVLSISSSLIWSFYVLKSTSYAVFSNLLLLHPSRVKIFSSSQIPSVSALSLMSDIKFHTQTILWAKLWYCML